MASEGHRAIDTKFQSLIGTVEIIYIMKSIENTAMFQSLIGTVEIHKDILRSFFCNDGFNPL